MITSQVKKSTDRKRIIKLPEVIKRTGKGRSSIYAGVDEGSFPAPIKIGKRASGWVEEEIEEWIDVRISASRNVEGV